MATTIAVPAIATVALAGSFPRNPPTVVVTAPTGTIETETTTVTWTYNSPLAKTQVSYRVEFYIGLGTATLVYTSGTVASAATSFVSPFNFSDLSLYTVYVHCSDGVDEGSGWSAFRTDLNDVTDFATEAALGSVYEIAINGQGYMLADHPSGDFAYSRRVGVLDPQRFATGETPFSQAIDRYSFVGYGDWSGGAGQRFRDRADSVANRYLDSLGINPFEPGELRALPAMEQINGSFNPDAKKAVVAGTAMYFMTNTPSSQLWWIDALPDTFTNITGAGGSDIVDITTDGVYWYACTGSDIYRNNTTGAGVLWSTIDAKVLDFAGDRILAAYASTGTAPNVFTTLNDAGAEEVVSGRITLRPGWAIQSFATGDGYVWFSVKSNTDRGYIYAWQIGTEDTPFVVWEAPAGTYPTAIFYYQGSLFIRTREPRDSGAYGTIWQAPVSDGRPSPSIVVEIHQDDTYDHGEGGFVGDGEKVLFTWQNMTAPGGSFVSVTSYSGMGCINLPTGGYAKWMHTSGLASAIPRHLARWQGRVVLGVSSAGNYYETDEYEPVGQLTMSISDLGTVLPKVFDNIEGALDPLPEDWRVVFSTSFNSTSSFSSVTNVVYSDTPGETQLESLLGDQADSVCILVEIYTPSASDPHASTPVVRSVAVRCHPLSVADEICVLPINCSDRIKALNSQEIVDSGPGSGAARARTLSNLASTRVRLQDVDYGYTGVTTTWEVIGVEVRRIGAAYDRSTNLQSHDMITILTLRRVFT